MKGAVAAVLALWVTGAGAFELREGYYSVPTLHGEFTQWGGTAVVSAITHEGQWFHHDTITIHDGLFYSGEIDGRWINGYILFTQNGGLHMNSNGVVLASSRQRYVNRGGRYYLNGGFLKTSALVLAGGAWGDSGGSYVQSGGTNEAESFMVDRGGSANISGGVLVTTNLTVHGMLSYSRGPVSVTYVLDVARFEQAGGEIVVQGALEVSAGASATVKDGTLRVSRLTVRGGGLHQYSPNRTGYIIARIEHFGGNVQIDQQLSIGTKYTFESGSLSATRILVGALGVLEIKSPEISNPDRVFLSGGKLDAAASCELGRLVLRTNSITSMSELVFSGAQVVQFRNSSMVSWYRGAQLVVRNWQGDGRTRLVFGSNHRGLTPRQLRQIIFENPATLPEGNYAARLLRTGEVVPHIRTFRQR